MVKLPQIVRKKYVIPLTAVVILAIIVAVGVLLSRPSEEEPDFVNVATLEKIVNISNISSFSSVYKGVVQVNNEKKTENVDYYVCYTARIKAGIDLSQVRFDIDEEEKTVTVIMPEVTIQEAAVDMTSLDFMFYNKKANQSSVTAQAQELCQKDLDNEINNKPAILELAEENAKNILEALLKPILTQMDEELQLVIE